MGQSTLTSSNMKMFVVLALAVLAAAEPEADPQLLVSGIHGVHTPYTHVAPVSTYSSPLLKTLVNSIVPAVKSIIPAVQTVATTPFVSTYNTVYGSGYPLTYGAHAYGVIAAPKAVITNYQDSEHYTAEATPLGKALGEPSYVAKNGEVVHKVEKREAEADAALFPFPSVYNTRINSVYNRAVVSPYTYGSSLYRNVLPAVSYRSPCIGCHPALSHMIHKREAEADPALVYSGLTHTPFAGINSVYNTAAVINPISYSGLTHTPFTGINSVYNTAPVNPVVYSTPAVNLLYTK